MTRIKTPNTTHLYQLSIADDKGAHAGSIEVEANTRAQARKIAERAGYSVRDVNMVG